MRQTADDRPTPPDDPTLPSDDGEAGTKARLEAFSDAVLAIAITLLVIELRPPDISGGQRLTHALWQQWPSYLAYLVSFVTIGVIWLNHHWLLERVAQVDGPLLVLNLNMLLWAALLSFSTAVLAEHLGAGGEPARTAAVLYSGVLFLLALAAVALLDWVTHDQRLHRLPPAMVGAVRRQFLGGLAIYGLAFALSWVSPWLGLGVCGAMALNHGRHHPRRRPDTEPAESAVPRPTPAVRDPPGQPVMPRQPTDGQALGCWAGRPGG